MSPLTEAIALALRIDPTVIDRSTPEGMILAARVETVRELVRWSKVFNSPCVSEPQRAVARVAIERAGERLLQLAASPVEGGRG